MALSRQRGVKVPPGELDFIVRMMQKRYLMYKGVRTNILVLAVAYFVMVWIGKSERREVLRTHIVE